MADRQDLFDKVNELLENTDITYELKDVSDLESFLENEENQQYEEYEEIERIYDLLMEQSSYEDE